MYVYPTIFTCIIVCDTMRNIRTTTHIFVFIPTINTRILVCVVNDNPIQNKYKFYYSNDIIFNFLY